MTAILALLGRAWPYLLPLVLGLSFGGWTIHRADSVALAHSQMQTVQAQKALSDYKAEVAAQHARDEQAAREAMQKIIDDTQSTLTRNEAIVRDFKSKADSAAADAEFARRLLAAAQKAGANDASHNMPETPSQRGADDPAGASGGGQLTSMVTASAAECRDAIQRLSALQAELAPQL